MRLQDTAYGADGDFIAHFLQFAGDLAVVPPIMAEPEPEEMMKLFGKYKDWIADERRMKLAKPMAQYMHCLPCERSAEVSDIVLDGKWGNACFNEAENRLHAQKGVMAAIIP